eukprot:TRINITY_DN2856_c0_g1_i7.p1 TRINITY_DN2856_c0_g1~~TRINITY_DN2856_c0_g1_i7.p1  ORF type:complete len:571 (-),score=124.70 TRINITY_DN2856_c0_g1_i7:66-1778(-)
MSSDPTSQLSAMTPEEGDSKESVVVANQNIPETREAIPQPQEPRPQQPGPLNLPEISTETNRQNSIRPTIEPNRALILDIKAELRARLLARQATKAREAQQQLIHPKEEPSTHSSRPREQSSPSPRNQHIQGKIIIAPNHQIFPANEKSHPNDNSSTNHQTIAEDHSQGNLDSGEVLTSILSIEGDRTKKTDDSTSGSGDPSTQNSAGIGFGPLVVRTALASLGGKASAVAVAEWIADNRPQFLTYFGSHKKLRYSVSGILSARTYANIFAKKVYVIKGIRKADWILLDRTPLPNDPPFPIEMTGRIPFPENDTPSESTSRAIKRNLARNSSGRGWKAPARASSEEKIRAVLADVLALSDNKPTSSSQSSMSPSPREGNIKKEAMDDLEIFESSTPRRSPEITEEEDPEDILDLIKPCQTCHIDKDNDKLLLCDRCDLGFHTYCLDPPLEAIPEGSWFCATCEKEDIIPEDFSDSEDTENEEEMDEADDDVKEMEMDYDTGDEERERRPVHDGSRVCDKHRRWKKRCPENCPWRNKPEEDIYYRPTKKKAPKKKDPTLRTMCVVSLNTKE